LPVVLYGYETWSLTLRVFENTVPRRKFGTKGDDVTEEWRELRNEKLNEFHSSPDSGGVIKSRRMRWAGQIARMGKEDELQDIGVEI